MANIYTRVLDEGRGMPRKLEPHWNHGLIAASIAISLLGAFTSTQLMCQARTSRFFSGTLVWTILGSLTFGFCAIWSEHYVAMLAYEVDVPVGMNVPLTVLSSFLAVVFTFVALASDLLWDRYKRKCLRKNQRRKNRVAHGLSAHGEISKSGDRESSKPLLLRTQQEEDDEDDEENLLGDLESATPGQSSHRKIPNRGESHSSVNPRIEVETPSSTHLRGSFDPAEPSRRLSLLRKTFGPDMPSNSFLQLPHSRNESTETIDDNSDAGITDSIQETSSEYTTSRKSSSLIDSSTSTFGLGKILSIRPYQQSATISRNAFVATGKAIYYGSTPKNILKGFCWSLAITSMHYVGILALEIPDGFTTINPYLVIVAGTICWIVCFVGCILLVEIEVHLAQQFLFSMVATCGVLAMHYTAMRGATFWSYQPPSESRGYPLGLSISIGGIAVATCIVANGLLAHSATVSRNKLAEIVYTRRKLWRAIAERETAESAAAARSDFIASASHEIRTPLHHLQGYSDLLSRTELTEEGRLLLFAIQRATKTLSLITNNVLDWSRLEKDGEAVCRPVALNIRTVCDSIITLIPNQDEEVEVDLMVVVEPNVPHSLFLDETYIHRILMNLLSNALKFTSSGYILLLIQMKEDKLVASVTDTGCGVPPSFLPQLFEPFKQAQTRGRQRGTGLGLSIIKQLLHKMQGDIEVNSKFQDAEGVGPEQSGSKFTITVPVQSASFQLEPGIPNACRKIAIFHAGNKRSLGGLRTAWERAGFEVVIVNKFSDTLGLDLKYIWADLPSLKQDIMLRRKLLSQTKCLVLVPYDMQSTLHEIPELIDAPQHFIPLQKPLLWHAIERRIAASSQLPSKVSVPRAVRFDPNVEVLEEGSNKMSPTLKPVERGQDSVVARKPVVLLVEDNPINCKLGKKMLQSLGYDVLIAEDGIEALEQLVRHDQTVDAILMDQSMPRKDGLTATKEIREMEAAGTLSRRRPIIAVTAVVSNEARALCMLAGTDDFVAKPLSLGKLEQVLATYLNPSKP